MELTFKTYSQLTIFSLKDWVFEMKYFRERKLSMIQANKLVINLSSSAVYFVYGREWWWHWTSHRCRSQGRTLVARSGWEWCQSQTPVLCGRPFVVFSPQHQLHLSCPIPLLSASTNLILKNDFNLYSCAKENLSVVYVYVFVRAVKTQGPVNFLYRSNPSGLSSLQGPYHTTGGTVKPR